MPRGRPRKNPVAEEENIKTAPAKSKASASSKTKKSSGKSSTAKKTSSKNTAKKSTSGKSKQTLEKQGDYIFSLDIGTRTVVAVLSKLNEDDFEVLESVSLPHVKRAMKDGQIEDIEEVAKMVKKSKSELEKLTGIKLSKVSIAAAGRTLKTQRIKTDIDVSKNDVITSDMVKSFEIEAVSKAQSVLDEQKEDSNLSFFCVGHSIVNYYLDDYPIQSFVGHKGKKATVDMIAAFLPSIVVESLYAVTDKAGLEVESLTLEPIAAMNVIVPPETRLINVALVDIGAGTSDIAVAKNGSITAYAMATTAGDEITEEIIKQFLVDFDTAERMKMSSGLKEIKYKDILGFEHNIPTSDFFKQLLPAIENLSSAIVDNILEANGEAPAVVFLVGGGSLIPGLAKIISNKLSIPDNRVALGGNNYIRSVKLLKKGITGPEYVTPIGIGVTSTMEQSYDFSTVILNGKKIRVFNNNHITILDLLTLAGYKSSNIIGRSGRNLSFTINGEPQLIKGEIATPAMVTINDIPANIGSTVNQGDKVIIVPAENGMSAQMTLLDIAGEGYSKTVFLSDIPYNFGKTITVNGHEAASGYEIQNFDDIRITEITTLGELIESLNFKSDKLNFYQGKRKLNDTYILKDNDRITVEEINPDMPEADHDNAEDEITPVQIEIDNEFSEQIEPELKPADPEYITITLNGRKKQIEKHSDGTHNLFLEVIAASEIDTKNPQGNGVIVLKLNDQNAGYMDIVNNGDTAVVKWE